MAETIITMIITMIVVMICGFVYVYSSEKYRRRK